MNHKPAMRVNPKAVAEIYRCGEGNPAILPLTASFKPNFKPDIIMKTLSAFFFLLMVSSLVAFFSCKKKDDPAPTSVDGLLTYKAWQLTSIFYDGDQTLEKYQEDDYFVFYSNGTCVFITGESQERDSSLTKKVPPKKIPNKQINGVSTWALSGDHKTLITGLLGGSSQITITKDKLVLTKITGPVANNSASYQVLTCKPKEGEIAGGAVVLDGRFTYNSNNSKFIY